MFHSIYNKLIQGFPSACRCILPTILCSLFRSYADFVQFSKIFYGRFFLRLTHSHCVCLPKDTVFHMYYST